MGRRRIGKKEVVNKEEKGDRGKKGNRWKIENNRNSDRFIRKRRIHLSRIRSRARQR